MTILSGGRINKNGCVGDSEIIMDPTMTRLYEYLQTGVDCYQSLTPAEQGNYWNWDEVHLISWSQDNIRVNCYNDNVRGIFCFKSSIRDKNN